MASSEERGHILEVFEVQNQEGPCLDCYRSGEAVVNVVPPRRGEARAQLQRRGPRRWLPVCPRLPLRLRDQVLGALNLFSDEESHLGETELVVGQALADVATAGLLQARAMEQSRALTEQLQTALNSRAVIEQAKGMLAERAAVDFGAAFRLLRRYARDHNVYLGDLAREVVEGGLPVAAVTSAVRGAEKRR